MSRASIVDRIADFNRGRDPERLALKLKAMQKNALSFLRGTCHLFCEDWPRGSALDDTPAVWVCGDVHIENFGAYKGDNRLVYFDIGDFDESILAPCAWDLARVATSALVMARTHELKRKQGIKLCEALLDAYRQGLEEGRARWIERATARGPIKTLLHRVGGEDQRSFIASRTKRGSRGLRLDIDRKHTLAATDKERRRVERLLCDFAKKHAGVKPFEVVDVARRIAGTGALGLERYTILVRARRAPGDHFLFDLKFATPSALAPYVSTQQPRWKTEAERIVGVQQRMQAISPALLHAVPAGSKSYVLRELMPTQDKLDLTKWSGKTDGLAVLADDIGYLLAWSELRSGGRQGSATIDELIAFAAHRRWRRSIIDYADEYHDVVRRDWKAYCEAYRDRAFDPLVAA